MNHIKTGKIAYIKPGYMAHASMFYLIDLLYSGQLTKTKRIRPDLVPRPPEYFFVEFVNSDLAIIQGQPPQVRQGL